MEQLVIYPGSMYRPLSATWKPGAKLVLNGVLALLARAFQAVRITRVANMVLPVPLRGLALFTFLPLVFTIPLSFTFTLSEYYVEFKYYWIMCGPYLHGGIAGLLLYRYRKSHKIKTFTKLCAAWFFIAPIFPLIFQENASIFKNYSYAIFIYMALAVVINNKEISKHCRGK